MLKEIEKLKEELLELKKAEVEKLKNFDSGIDINSFIKKNLKLHPRKISHSKIKISNLKKFFRVKSSLPTDKHEYIYLESGIKDLKSEMMNYLSNNKSPFVEISFQGSKIGDVHVELHFIIDYKNGSRDSKRLFLDQTSQFKIEDEVLNLKVAIRIKGSGHVFLNYPLLIFGEKREGNFIDRQTELKAIKDLEVIFIADEFTTKCFQEEFKIVAVSPEKWADELRNKTPDLFFCESAWLGNNGKWKDKVGTGGPRDNTTLLELVKWCNLRNIPTVFWNKEDPFHYQAFIETAKHFDYVFTTDSDSISKYNQNDCKNVYTLPFAAQPKLHNPIEKYNRKNKVVFAGAYYGEKFPERKKAMDNMINISGKYGLEIYDRNLNIPESPNQFPDEFKEFIVGTLPSEKIDKAYKGYKVALNVNSIVDSPTMFSRRVFEILASNTPVVSSESLGMKNFFGDLLTISSDFNKLKEGISRYFTDEHFYKQNRLSTLRRIFEEHTYEHRVMEILNKIEIPYIKEEQVVAFVGVVRSSKDLEVLMEIYKSQTLTNKLLVLLIDIFDGYLEIFNTHNRNDITTFLLDYIHHYPSLDKMIKSKYIIPLSTDHLYGPNYGRDLFISTKFTNKNTVIVKGFNEEYVYTTGGQIEQSLLPLEVLSFLSPDTFVEMLEQRKSMSDWFRFGISFFNNDNFNCIPSFKQVDNIEYEKSIKFM